MSVQNPYDTPGARFGEALAKLCVVFGVDAGSVWRSETWTFARPRTTSVACAEALRRVANTAHALANELERAELEAREAPYVEQDEDEAKRCGCGKPNAHPKRCDVRCGDCRCALHAGHHGPHRGRTC